MHLKSHRRYPLICKLDTVCVSQHRSFENLCCNEFALQLMDGPIRLDELQPLHC